MWTVRTSPLARASGAAVHAVRGRPVWSWRTLILAALATAIALAVDAPRLLWSVPPSRSLSGTCLGGPELAMNARLSPDGQTLAFLTFVGELTQVAVMKPGTGNWTVLTSNSGRGSVQELSWSRDGTRIYYDRRTDVPKGIYSVSVFGGDEDLVLRDAENPQTLPDGSLLVLRSNAERKERLFRYGPATGQMQPFPVEILKSDAHSPVRVFPDGRSAAVVGRPILPGPYPSSLLLLLVDLALGGVRVLDNGDPPVSLAIALDGKSILAGNMSGDLSTIQTSALGGTLRRPTLIGVAHPMHLDIGPDGSLYTDEVDRASALSRIRQERYQGTFPSPGSRSSQNAPEIRPGLWRFEERTRAKGQARQASTAYQ